MDSSTWDRSARLPGHLGGRRGAAPDGREGSDADRQLEHWHQSSLGNFAYLAVFVIVALLTVLAFVPVWLLLQGQRAWAYFAATCVRLSGRDGQRS